MSQHISPISISRRLIQHDLYAFNSRTVSALFGLDKYQTHSLLRRMEQAGLVASIEPGKYLLLGLTPEKTLANPLYIGCNLVTPSYISFWSALHYHGLTEQAPRTVFIATTKRKKEVVFRTMRFKFITLRPQAFFGYRREALAELPVVVADEAKSILDALSLPRYAGGLSEIAKALRNAVSRASLEISVLIGYAGQLQSASLSSRLGFLLDLLGQPSGDLKASSGPVRLDPARPVGGKFIKRWQLYVNVEPDELFPDGVA